MPRRLWTEDEVNRARDMRAAGHPYGKIDKALGRRAGATQQRLEIAGYSSGQGVGRTAFQMACWPNARRLPSRATTTLTQNFFGDPPPGYSALDGKTGLR
jgi:hypothetical protein